jgi:hypothetical protein
MAEYMVLCNQHSGSVFVKEREFFISQGGDKEDWGRNWILIEADSIEGAREKGCNLPGARPYHRQAKGGEP